MEKVMDINFKSIFAYKIVMWLESSNQTMSIKSATEYFKTHRSNIDRAICELKEHDILYIDHKVFQEKFYRLKC